MEIKQFNIEKRNLKRVIKYNESVPNSKEIHKSKVEGAIDKLCWLYINENKSMKESSKYYSRYKELLSEFDAEDGIALDTEVEPKTAKEILSSSDIKYIKKLMSNSNIRQEQKKEILIEEFGIYESKLYEWFDELGIQTGPTHFEKAKFNKLKKSKRYIISSAQTASNVNMVFFNNMVEYAKFIDAEIGVIATRYRNPTSIWKEEGDVWDAPVQPYLTAMRQDLHESVSLLADLKIQATSPNPTGRVDAFEGGKSLIVGSPCIEMRSVATLPDQDQKFIWSTGSLTEPSFTDTVAGGTAADKHAYGFVVVEVDKKNNIAHIRSVRADVDGSFNDLIFRVEDSKIFREDVPCLVWGDSHFAQKEESVTNAFRKICKDLEVTKSVLHDIWDSVSINVHNLKDPVVQHQLSKSGRDDLRKELDQMIEELNWFSKNMKETIVVGSNHDDMLDRAMSQSDWRANLKNAEIFVEMLGIKLSGKAPNGLVAHYVDEIFDNILCLNTNESFLFNGIELALHGHKGPNGSRGNANAFGKLITPNVIGHSHSPCIKWNCYQVGVSCSLYHGYNKGLSGWAYAGVTINKHGNRQMIILNKKTLTYTTLY